MICSRFVNVPSLKSFACALLDLPGEKPLRLNQWLQDSRNVAVISKPRGDFVWMRRGASARPPEF
jgi:hypothetical protein